MTMYKTIIAALTAVAIASPALANDEQFQAWGGVFATKEISDNSVLWLEAQTRFSDGASRLGQLLLRPGLGFNIGESSVAFIGYAYVRTASSGAATTHEHRIWQQLTHTFTGEGASVTLWSRTRFEQRFLENSGDMGLRFRQLIRATTPIQDGLLAVFWTEPFLNLNNTNWGQRSGVDQWRNFVGLNVSLSPSLSLEAGYLNQFVARPGVNRVNHILNVGTNIRF